MKYARRIRKSFGETIFDAANIIFMCLLMIVMVYPFYYVLCGSLSDPIQLLSHNGMLYRSVGFTWNAYHTALANPMLLSGFANTLVIVCSGTLINITLTTLSGYALAQKGPRLIPVIMKICVFTMFFSGGIIPNFLLVRNLGLLDTHAALILPGAISTTNLIIMRTAFQTLPNSLAESARIDGANDLVVFVRIALPLCLATTAVLSMYYAVDHWNSWFNSSIYLRTRSKFPLQLILRDILIADNTDTLLTKADGYEKQAEGDTLKYAMMIIATVPIVMIYPFVQKYFTKGVMIGAIKS